MDGTNLAEFLRNLADKVETPPPEPAPPRRWCTVTEYASWRHLHPQTVRKYIKQGMPAYKTGRAYRIDIEEADAWISAGGAVGYATRCGYEQARGLH